LKLLWAKLHALAVAEVASTLAALPAPLRERAHALPVTFERRPNRAQLRDAIEPDTLGLFIGPEFADEENAALPLPPQIILFLDNIWDQAEASEEQFRKEVHTTFLHELGHYLGLDEDGLIERGLE
jgi:predicted Zn-dependent protease with MMP-like domain